MGDDPIQQLVGGVFSGNIQRSIAESMGATSVSVGFVSMPTYEPRLAMLDRIVSLGAIPEVFASHFAMHLPIHLLIYPPNSGFGGSRR